MTLHQIDEGARHRLWIVGVGGHAKVVIDTARAMGTLLPVGALDDDPARVGGEVQGVPILGAISAATTALLGDKAAAVVAVGDNRARARIVKALDGVVRWATLVHPSAVVASSAQLGEGTVVFANAVIQPDAVVGRHVIVNTAASIDHDCVVEDMVHVAQGVRIAGIVSVGVGALLGAGSCVGPGLRIGEWATVSTGGVVLEDVQAEAVLVGFRARQGLVDGDSR